MSLLKQAIPCHVHKSWGLIYSCTMRIVPHHASVIAHAMMSCMHCVAHTCRQTSCPSDSMACHNLIICLLFAQAEGLLLKLTASHFSTLITKITYQNMLESILIAMQDENKANCNENFRICLEESVDCLYKW